MRDYTPSVLKQRRILKEKKGEGRGFSDLSRFVKRSPHWSYLLLGAVIFNLINYFILKNVNIVLFGIIGSYILLIALDYVFVRIVKLTFPLKRILYLDFTSFSISMLFFWILYFIRVFGNNYEIMLMVAISSATLLRVLIFYTYYSDRPLRLAVPSLNYTYSAILCLFLIFRQWYEIIPFVVSSVIYLIGGIIFIKSSTKEFSKRYGVSASKILQMFLNYNSDRDQDEVGKKFFSRIYNHSTRVPVKVMDILREDGSRMVTAVFPYIHPGPFGELGSSNLPIRLQKLLTNLGSDVMTFHTTTTNSNNCSGDEDISIIADAVKQSITGMEYNSTVSRFKKITSGKIVIGLQKFGNSAFGAIIPEKEHFDDVKLKEGLKIISHVEQKHADNLALIDAQNNFAEKTKELDNCSFLSKSFSRELERLESKYPARVGYYRIYEPASELGAMGIQTISIDAGGKINSIVLTDSNNITAEVIEAARKAVGDSVYSLEIYTTDNHALNANNLDINPLGKSGDIAGIAEMIARCVALSIKDIQNVRIGFATRTVRVRMGQENAYQSLIDSTFRSLKAAKYTILITLPSSIAASLLVFRFVFPFA